MEVALGPGKLLGVKCFEQKYEQQLTREHLTLANVVLDSEGEVDDSSNDDSNYSVFAMVQTDDSVVLPPAPADGSIPKGKATIAQVILQELLGPDDEAIAHVDNPQAQLLRWHYRLSQLSFGDLQKFVKMVMLQRRLTHVRTPKCSAYIA